MKTRLLLPLFYRSTFLQHDAHFPCFFYLYSSPIFHLEEKFDLADDKSKIFFSHSSHDFRGFSLIPSIRKLFLLDVSSRSTNFLQISNAHVGSVVFIMSTSSFVELSCFSRFYTFSFLFKNL